MPVAFIQLSAFEKYRTDYLDERQFASLQKLLILRPDVGAIIKGSGGLRKLRLPDVINNKGTRGGLRLIYYFHRDKKQYWLMTIYRKSEMADLTPQQIKTLKQILLNEIAK